MAYQKNGAPVSWQWCPLRFTPLNSVQAEQVGHSDYASQRFAAYQGYWEDKGYRVVRRALTLPVIKKHTYTVKSWMQDQHLFPEIPSCTWNRPIGLGWDKPYSAQPSNLDDGPWHECPGWLRCRLHTVPHEATSTCAHDRWGRLPLRHRLSIQRLRTADSPSQAYALCTEPPVGTQRAWQWYPASGELWAGKN